MVVSVPGSVDVPVDRYRGAQTQRSLIHFSIGNDHMPIEVYHDEILANQVPMSVRGRLRQPRLAAVGRWFTGHFLKIH